MKLTYMDNIISELNYNLLELYVYLQYKYDT